MCFSMFLKKMEGFCPSKVETVQVCLYFPVLNVSAIAVLNVSFSSVVLSIECELLGVQHSACF